MFHLLDLFSMAWGGEEFFAGFPYKPSVDIWLRPDMWPARKTCVKESRHYHGSERCPSVVRLNSDSPRRDGPPTRAVDLRLFTPPDPA